MDRGHWACKYGEESMMFNSQSGSVKRKAGATEEPKRVAVKRSHTVDTDSFNVLNPHGNLRPRPSVSSHLTSLPHGPDLLISTQQHHQPTPPLQSRPSIPAITFASPDYKPPPRELFHQTTHTFATPYQPPPAEVSCDGMEVDDMENRFACT